MLQNLPNSFVTSKEVSTLIPNAINNFYTLWWRQQTAKGSVAHFSTLTTWGDWDEKCGNFMTASHYFSVLHSGAAGFCTRKSGFTILNTHTQVLYPLFRGFFKTKSSTFRLQSGNTSWPMGFNPNIFLFWIFAPKMAKVPSIDFLVGKWNNIASHAML